MGKRICVLALLLFFLAPSVKGLEEEEKAANLLIVVDSSKSMEQLTEDGKERLEVIKATLGELADGISDNVNVGMMVFGHRGRQYGCKDVEMVIPVGPLDAAIVKKELSLLQPRGMTPLAASLEEAAKNLEVLKGRSCILLLSDGEETCGGRPVETARWIKEKYGISVVIDVVGFHVTQRAQRQLSAIAAAGGGEYYGANSPAEISFVLTNVLGERIEKQVGKRRMVWEGGEKAAGAGEEETDKDRGPGILILHYSSEVPKSISIYNQETGKQTAGSHMWIHIQNKYKTHIEPGVYRLSVERRSGSPLDIRNVVIKTDRETSINIR